MQDEIGKGQAAWPRDRRAIFSWCLYDWGNSAFPTIIGTFIFSVYYARGIYGDETAGAASWAYALSLSGLIVAVLSPIFGAIADHSGALKRWLLLFTALCCLPTALLWLAKPDPSYAMLALVLVVLANVAFELGQMIYNALLPVNAPPGMTGRVSGWGWGIGYIGGLLALATTLVLFVGLGDGLKPLIPLDRDSAEHLRAVGPLTAIWFVIFSLPIFLWSRDRVGPGEPLRIAIPKGLRQLANTIRQARRHGMALRYLVASAIYRDGLTTLFAVGGLYAAGVYGMDTGQILIFAIGLNVTAGLGAIGFAWLDDGWGSRRTVLLSLAGLIAVGLPILFVEDKWVFIGAALALGIFVGPTQAASRSLMAKLAPPEMEAEMFGLYALTGKAAAVLGPALYGLASEAFDSQRAGMSTIILLFAIGGALLLTVREPKL